MTTFVALLCAVNVGGTGKLPMAELRALLAGLGYKNVETYIQSGNAVFDAKGTAAAVTRAVAAALAQHMGAPVGVMIRTHEELGRVIAENPFAAEAAADGARVHVGFLGGAVIGPAAKDGAAQLDRIGTKYPARRDRYHLGGRHALSAFAGWRGGNEVHGEGAAESAGRAGNRAQLEHRAEAAWDVGAVRGLW